jgi:hypothetical protein
MMSGGPGKTRQAKQDRYCAHDRPLALAAHSHAVNDFGSLEYPYRANRAEHYPDARSYPHRWLHSRHKTATTQPLRKPMVLPIGQTISWDTDDPPIEIAELTRP